MTSASHTGGAPVDTAKPLRPQLFFRTITFSNGTELELEEDALVLFVGPNNACKNAALRELEAWENSTHYTDQPVLDLFSPPENTRTFIEPRVLHHHLARLGQSVGSKSDNQQVNRINQIAGD